MSFAPFLAAYHLTKPLAGEPPLLNDPLASRGIANLPLGVYNDGTLTLLPRDEAASLTELATKVFPNAAGTFTVFAVD